MFHQYKENIVHIMTRFWQLMVTRNHLTQFTYTYRIKYVAETLSVFKCVRKLRMKMHLRSFVYTGCSNIGCEVHNMIFLIKICHSGWKALPNFVYYIWMQNMSFSTHDKYLFHFKAFCIFVRCTGWPMPILGSYNINILIAHYHLTYFLWKAENSKTHNN